MLQQGLTAAEKRAAFSLAGIFSLRMLGLFMILPVFALYARDLDGVTPMQVGLAIGIYGLTQALLQIPMGMLSDRYGRKPIIAIGLAIFAVGSVVAAMADDIFWVIIGRALQGSGAIAAAIMAFAADLTRETVRLRIMAIIGMSIGLSFAVAIVLGPLLNNWVGVPGIFWLTAILAVLGIVFLYKVVPAADEQRHHRDTQANPAQIMAVLKDKELLQLDFGVLILHMVLTASFVALPIALVDHAGFAAESHWMVYLGVMLVAMLAMVPFVVIAEKRRKMKPVFIGSILIIVVAELCLAAFNASLAGIIFSLCIFFIAFNVLEATMPSIVAKKAPVDKKGTAMGAYASSQFIGAFLGGICGGWLLQNGDVDSVFIYCAIMGVAWSVVAMRMERPEHLSTFVMKVGKMDHEGAENIRSRILQVAGVAEATIAAEDGVAYLKVDRTNLDEQALNQFAQVEV